MEVYLSLDKAGLSRKPQAKREIIDTKRRTAVGWQKIEVGAAAELIGNRGHAVIPGHLAGGLKAQDCKAMQVFMLDFDDGVSFTEIKSRCDETGLPVAFAYHTFSSSVQKEKFRIAFVHESLIEDNYISEVALSMLHRIFPECDNACSDLSRMYYGGKELIYLDEGAHFALVQLLLPFYNAIDENKNFSRNIDSFSRKHRIVQYNGRLAAGDSSFFQDFQEYDGNKDSVMIHTIRGVPFPSFCIAEGKRGKGMHQSIRCRLEMKKLEIRKGRGCRLLDDFLSGVETGHDQRFAILTNLMRIKGGVKCFFEVMEGAYGESVEKWKKDIHHMKGYKPKKCSERFCPYYGNCEHEGTIVDTIDRERQIYRQDVEYYSLEEAVECMEENLERAYRTPGSGIHLIRAQTGIGKTAAYIRLIKREAGRKFIIAVPTTRLKEEIKERLIRAGIREGEIFVTKNINGNCLIPREIQEAVSAAHDRGDHELPKKIVRDYYKEIRDDEGKRAVAEECRLYLEGIQALKEERIIVTTHAYFVNMDRPVLRDYTVIIDEDILQLYLLKQTACVSMDSLRILEKSGIHPYCDIAGQMTRAEEDCYHVIYTRPAAIPLSTEELEGLGCLDGSNINDMVYAGSFIRMKSQESGEPVVTYFCPRLLPRARYIILSATLNEMIYRKYFEKKTEVYSYPEKRAEYKGKLIQYTYFSLGRQDLRKRKQVFSYAKKAAGDRNVEIITFKEAAWWDEMRGNNRYHVHFGNSTGINALEGKDLVIIGTPYSIPEAYKLVACCLGADVNRETDREPKLRRVEYKDSSFLITTYDDPLLREIQLYAIESEMEQCIGRTRLLRQDCSVYVFSSFPCEQSEIHIKDYLAAYEEGEQEDVSKNKTNPYQVFNI